jgi:predicted DNA-binding protein (MmcQ/YjbR family)
MGPMISIEQVCGWCQEQAHSTMDNVFGDQTNVYRVGGKMFALVNVDPGNLVTLKVLPEDGEALRAIHSFVKPGYYMDKRHWISVDLVPEVTEEELSALIEDSYQLVLASLTKKLRDSLVGSTQPVSK